MRLQFFPLLSLFVTCGLANFVEFKTTSNKTYLLGIFESDSIKSMDLTQNLMPIKFLSEFDANQPTEPPHDPHENSGGHGGEQEMETWMKRMLYMLMATLICTVVGLVGLLILLFLIVRSQRRGVSSKL